MTRVKPLSARFRRGQWVRVHDDVEDARYAGRDGTVLEVLDPLPPHYPRGAVAVELVWPRRVDWRRLFGTTPPARVHFRPNDLMRSR